LLRHRNFLEKSRVKRTISSSRRSSSRTNFSKSLKKMPRTPRNWCLRPKLRLPRSLPISMRLTRNLSRKRRPRALCRSRTIAKVESDSSNRRKIRSRKSSRPRRRN